MKLIKKQKDLLNEAISLIGEEMYLSKDSKHYEKGIFGKGIVEGLYLSKDVTLSLQFVTRKDGNVVNNIWVNREDLEFIN